MLPPPMVKDHRDLYVFPPIGEVSFTAVGIDKPTEITQGVDLRRVYLVDSPYVDSPRFFTSETIGDTMYVATDLLSRPIREVFSCEFE